MWVGNEMKSSVKVAAEMKCAIQEAAEMICAMEVATEVKSTLNKNHPWSMKAATKIKIYEGCSNCNEIYDVSIMWNEWKAATKMKFKLESSCSKHSEICDGSSN